MYKFLRISSSYPEFLSLYEKKIRKNKHHKYHDILENYFEESYSVSNNITIELKKRKYECFEVISNFTYLQNKWIEQYGNKNSNENIVLQQIKFYKPDIIYFGNVDLVTNNFISEIKKLKFIKILIGFHCAPFNNRIFTNLNNLDCIVTCTKGYLHMLKNKLNKPILLMQHSFPVRYSKKKLNRSIDITFIGSIFVGESLHNKRVNLIFELMKNFKNSFIAINFSKKLLFTLLFRFFRSIYKFQIFSEIIFIYKIIYIYFFSKKPVFGQQMFDIISDSKILVNTHIDDTEYAGNMRLFEGTGLGCLVLTDIKKELNNLFKIGKEIDVFENEKELIEKCKFYLSNIQKINTISLLGQKKTIENYNYEKRISILDEYIKSKLEKNEKNL